MPRRITLATILLVAMTCAGKPSAADLDPEKVRQSIDRGVAWLKKTQVENGTWPAFLSYDLTPLCTLALLNAGVDPQDPVVQKALKYIRDPAHQPTITYQVALQTMVLSAAEPKRDMLVIRRNAKWLEDNQIKSGTMKGGWSYPTGKGDNSNSQFALLGLHEAQRVGVPVKDETWRLALSYWQGAQNADGSWDYLPGQAAGGSGSMTCAGICSLIIASGRLNRGDAVDDSGRIRCCGEQQDNEAVERGLRWLAKNFSVEINPGGEGRWVLYYLYALERTGRLSARRFIGGHDWYREGTEYLLDGQDVFSGLWRGGSPAEKNEHIATSLALLFLVKGRRPVLLAKLQHGEGGDWNNHRSDAANLTSYVEPRWKRDLTWQTINLERANTEDLLQSPVLYMSGSKAPRLDADQIRYLREYLQRGGFFLAEACCDGGQEFDAGFRKLMKQVFPEPEYNLRLLEPDHPIWFAEEKVAPERTRPLWGINFGCRTSVVYSPPDPDRSRASLSCLWELANPDRESRHDKNVQAEIDAANSIGINILAYATNREVKDKYDLFKNQRPDQRQDPNDRGMLYIPKLRHGGGWNVAPGALLALQEAMISQERVRVSTEQREVSLDDDGLFNYHLVFMHGRNDFRFSQQERDRLRTYIERGGMVLADAVCASDAFAKAFRREMAAVFPEHPLERVPTDHALFTPAYGGFDLKTVIRREPGRTATGGIKSSERRVEPWLEGLQFENKRYSVLFSPFDLSCALESRAGVECRGYTRDDAARIGLNVVVYSLQE